MTSGLRVAVQTSVFGAKADRPLLATAIVPSNGEKWVETGPAAFVTKKGKAAVLISRASGPPDGAFTQEPNGGEQPTPGRILNAA